MIVYLEVGLIEVHFMDIPLIPLLLPISELFLLPYPNTLHLRFSLWKKRLTEVIRLGTILDG